MADAHRIHDAAETEQIGPMVDDVTIGLFWSHVLRSSRDDPALRQARVIDGTGESKIGEFDPVNSVFQQDIRRLHIAMNQSLNMGSRQSGRRLHADSQDLFEIERSFRIDQLLK